MQPWVGAGEVDKARSWQARLREGGSPWPPGTDHTVSATYRNYTVVNTEKGLMEVQRMCCPGMKVSCQLQVQRSLWTATEVSTAHWVQPWVGATFIKIQNFQITPSASPRSPQVMPGAPRSSSLSPGAAQPCLLLAGGRDLRW